MDKIIDNLWIGDLATALNPELLQQNGIQSVLTAMHGKIPIQKVFARYQVPLDDTADTDILVHFPACNAWIDSEIRKGRNVLVHCQAGMSRSVTIVAAYLMYSRDLDVEGALAIIREARPFIHPNDGFLAQLAIFHSAHYKRTRRNKETRAFYVERAAREVLNGDGSGLETEMFAKYPRSPSDSTPNTPYPQRRRRLRCKMCRQELATREHMVDHGQVGPATPATAYTMTPASSRRPSAGEANAVPRQGAAAAASADTSVVRRGSASSEVSRRPSLGSTFGPLTPIIAPESRVGTESSAKNRERRHSGSGQSQASKLRRKSWVASPTDGRTVASMTNLSGSTPDLNSASDSTGTAGVRYSEEQHAADKQSSSALESDEEDSTSVKPAEGKVADDKGTTSVYSKSSTPGLSSSRELAAQIHPNLAALRSSPLIAALKSSRSLDMTPMKEPETTAKKTPTSDSAIPPLLMPHMNCSGYFVEPMKWMEPFLQSGSMTGKIVCPNKKCGVKLGNYDWTGVCCSCKHWVVPGFCIHKSKVDEVVI